VWSYWSAAKGHGNDTAATVFLGFAVAVFFEIEPRQARQTGQNASGGMVLLEAPSRAKTTIHAP
jgi:hypothetical protein